MKNCNQFLKKERRGEGGGKFSTTPSFILSAAKNLSNSASLCAILATTALTACNNEESFDAVNTSKLSINVGVNQSNSRALITDAALPDGDAGAIGVMLAGHADYDAYTNVKFSGTTTSGNQSWGSTTDVLLTENQGTVYAGRTRITPTFRLSPSRQVHRLITSMQHR